SVASRYLPLDPRFFIAGSSGYFAISDLEGRLIAPAIAYRKLRLVQRANTLLTERREAAPSPDNMSGGSAAETL
ncbi:MAG: hypothetical protein KKB13_15640, partial [Chloroflexi bacterium]|nr:hypothetical protein [Chloroflexota bacterium]